MHARSAAWLLSLIIAGAAAWGYTIVTSEFDAAGAPRALCFVVIGAAGVLSIFLFPHLKQGRTLQLAIWLPAISLRILLLPAAPSDDVSRYLWEGQLVNEGMSPYAQTADSESVRAYRDAQWALMNHKDQPTAYPPLSELSFAVVAQVAYHSLAFKLLFVFADLLTLAAVLRLLQLRGIALQYSGFYALSPIILIAYAGEGHFDALMVAALAWGVWAAADGREKLSSFLVAMATGVKWISLPLLPFVIWGNEQSKEGGVFAIWTALRQRSPHLFIALLTLIFPALYFWESLPALFEGLFRFGGTRSFNGPVYDIMLLGLNLPRAVCSSLVIGLLAVVCLWRWSLRGRCTLDAHVRWILGVLIVLSPTVHFWYLGWVLPFVCLRPSLPWIILSLTSGLYFLVWSNEIWGLSVWQRWGLWSPFFLALIYEIWSTRGRVMFPIRRTLGESVTISIIIPTLNIVDKLEGALSCVAQQTLQPIEIICVDAGSSDGTVALAKANALPVSVIESEQGRGQQIATGIAAASGSWVCILHADALLSPQALECLDRSVSVDPEVCGGALGQRFADNHAELLPIEVLNDGRALFSRTAFGDQVQFFHRMTALRHQLMPAQPLMEDVESSWRLRETSGFVFMNQPCEVCHRSWNASEWFTRFRLVMSLVSRYRFARLRSRGQAEALSHSLYREYYKCGK
ncbi:glycosyltransferase [Coraliomargarita sp. SDUM461004]|uniref:Glycosyltransferase n=1 Tax=Thalassobacterium sedimentorum TaxID=3041258 RepID=A0ABU1AG03_9BACT|nr:glycosyltransferase [Coraliomargarita sp. SDUM461004]MDQ8193764.1 glycosyltransferase [Coraliomargarita sp. SDUM461004]